MNKCDKHVIWYTDRECPACVIQGRERFRIEQNDTIAALIEGIEKAEAENEALKHAVRNAYVAIDDDHIETAHELLIQAIDKYPFTRSK